MKALECGKFSHLVWHCIMDKISLFVNNFINMLVFSQHITD